MNHHVDVAISIDICQHRVHAGGFRSCSSKANCGSVHFSSIELARRQNGHSDNAIAFRVESGLKRLLGRMSMSADSSGTAEISSLDPLKNTWPCEGSPLQRGIVQTKSQVGEAGVFELIVSPVTSKLKVQQKTPGCGAGT